MHDSQALTIAKEWVGEWLRRVIAEREVIAPAPAHGGDTIFRRVSSPEQVRWDADNPLHPPKAELLPQTDPLAVITRNGQGVQVTPADGSRPRVLFLVRSCDAKGISFVTRMQAMDPPPLRIMKRAAERRM